MRNGVLAEERLSPLKHHCSFTFPYCLWPLCGSGQRAVDDFLVSGCSTAEILIDWNVLCCIVLYHKILQPLCLPYANDTGTAKLFPKCILGGEKDQEEIKERKWEHSFPLPHLFPLDIPLPLCSHASRDVWLIIEETTAPLAGSGTSQACCQDNQECGKGEGQCQSESDKRPRCAAGGPDRLVWGRCLARPIVSGQRGGGLVSW